MAFSFLDFATESKRVRLSRWEGGGLNGEEEIINCQLDRTLR